ncbi:uncharacterized protein F5147DRAFT_778882 [Suillus discolor]|uniref:Uncharacterized protein n=1 Tax=Suillus discolor TaxID=1912936 RepID=A0A9P7JPG1_9AGAM|nr:uncharacterized protein F5147DRAFT_778882 [Suillus discolor]KAG2094855.1 hypothetical protein F5147DRAFT_778882 [Suillus discolor]
MGIPLSELLESQRPVDISPPIPTARSHRLSVEDIVGWLELRLLSHGRIGLLRISGSISDKVRIEVIVLLAYLAAVLVCIIKDAPLISNPNRAGFLALAQFPVVFLFATKKLNSDGGKSHVPRRMHSWVPVGSQSSAVWICNYWSAERDFVSGFVGPPLHHRPYIFETSQETVSSSFGKRFDIRGILCHYMLPYVVRPWIFPPLAFYGADVLLHLFRYRIKDATLTVQDAHTALIRVYNSTRFLSPILSLSSRHHRPILKVLKVIRKT